MIRHPLREKHWQVIWERFSNICCANRVGPWRGELEGHRNSQRYEYEPQYKSKEEWGQRATECWRSLSEVGSLPDPLHRYWRWIVKFLYKNDFFLRSYPEGEAFQWDEMDLSKVRLGSEGAKMELGIQIHGKGKGLVPCWKRPIKQ